jgi:hypothetical protein
MDAKTLASWLIIAGLALVLVQIIVSLITALKAKKEKDAPTARGLGDVLSEILKALATAVPLGVLGVILIIVGAAIGGYLSLEALFPEPSSTPSS